MGTRVRREWSVLRKIIYRHLLAAKSEEQFDPVHVRDCWNECKDMREMELSIQHEGHFHFRSTTDLVVPADGEFAYYEVPADTAEVARVLRLFEDGQEQELTRDEMRGGSVDPSFTGQNEQYVPTYRMVGSNSIQLSPPPSAAQTKGLIIEYLRATDIFDADSSILSVDWPFFAESLLIQDTVIKLYDDEEAQAESGQDQVSGHRIWQRKYERIWEDYIAERTTTRTFVTPNPSQMEW